MPTYRPYPVGPNQIGAADAYMEISRDNLPGMKAEIKFGHSDQITTSVGTIWDDGGLLYSYPSSATTMTVSSTSANDTLLGSGARTIQIYGLDTDYNEIDETLELNGQAGVTSTKSYLRVFRMIVRSVGATGWNEGFVAFGTGTITAGVPAVAYARISFSSGFGNYGENQTLMAVYTVPAGKKGYITKQVASSSSQKPTEIWLSVRPFGECFQTKARYMVFGGSVTILDRLYIELPEKCDIEMRAATDVSTTDVSASLDILLIDNLSNRG